MAAAAEHAEAVVLYAPSQAIFDAILNPGRAFKTTNDVANYLQKQYIDNVKHADSNLFVMDIIDTLREKRNESKNFTILIPTNFIVKTPSDLVLTENVSSPEKFYGKKTYVTIDNKELAVIPFSGKPKNPDEQIFTVIVGLITNEPLRTGVTFHRIVTSAKYTIYEVTMITSKKSAAFMALEQAIVEGNGDSLDAAVKMAVSEGNDNALAEALVFAAKTDAIAAVTKITASHGMLLAGDCETAAAFAVSEGMVDVLQLEKLSLRKNPLYALEDYLTKRYRINGPSEESKRFVTSVIDQIFHNKSQSAIPTAMTILIPMNFTVNDAKKLVLTKNPYKENESVMDSEFSKSQPFENAASEGNNIQLTRLHNETPTEKTFKNQLFTLYMYKDNEVPRYESTLMKPSKLSRLVIKMKPIVRFRTFAIYELTNVAGKIR